MSNYDLDYTGQAVDRILDTGYDLQNNGYMFRGVSNDYFGTPTEKVWLIAGEGSTGHGFINPVPKGCIGICMFNGSSWTTKTVEAVAIDSVLTNASTNAAQSGATYTAITTLATEINAKLNSLTLEDTTSQADETSKLVASLKMITTGSPKILTSLTILAATVEKAGLLSAADKAKLDAILTNIRSMVVVDTTAQADEGDELTETLKWTVGGDEEVISAFTILAATTSKSGLMSADDKAKLDAILTNIRSMVVVDTTAQADEGDELTETLKWTVGGDEEVISAFTILAATTSKSGLMSADDKAKLDTLFADGYKFAGVAVPSTTPMSTTAKIFYIATEAGTYFNSVTVTQGINILSWDGSAWSAAQVIGIDDTPMEDSDNIAKSGGVFSFVKEEEKTITSTLYDKDGNIITKDEMTTSNGVYISGGGTLGYGGAYAITGYTYIKGCNSLKWHGYLAVSQVNVAAVAFYDKDKNFISSVSVGSTGTYTSNQTEIEISSIPSNAEYIRACTYKSYDYFEVKTDVFGIDLLRKEKDEDLGTLRDSVSVQTLYDKGGNFVTKEEITSSNGIYIGSDGKIYGSAEYAITDYIYMKGCTKILWHGKLPVAQVAVAAIAFYDEDRTFISSISVGSSGTYTTAQTEISIKEADIPSGAAYIRACTQKAFDKFFVWGDFSIPDNNELKLYEQERLLTAMLYDKEGNAVTKEDITSSNGVYILDDGTLGYNAAYAITRYIYMKGCQSLKWYGYLSISQVNVAAIAFYDEDKEFISSVSVGPTGTYTSKQTCIEIDTIPSNAAYIRACTFYNYTIFEVSGDIKTIELVQESTSLRMYADGIAKVPLFNPIKETPGLAALLNDLGIIGDSLSSGEIAYNKTSAPATFLYYDAYPFSWGQQIMKLVNGHGVNYSVGGLTTSSWWQRYIVSQTSGWSPDGESSIFGQDIHSAYTIALGTNDYSQDVPVGDVDTDIDMSDYNNNAATFAGNYGKIIQKIRELNDRSPIFCIIYPNSSIMPTRYDSVIKEMPTLFDGVWVIDLRTDFRSRGISIASYIFGGHYTTQGYMVLAYAIMNEMENVIRNNKAYFDKFALVGTEVQDEDIVW